MTDNAFLIFLGAAFPTLVALGAIVVAWRSTVRQIQASRNAADKNAREARDLDERNDTRQRWWEAVMWFHENRKLIGEPAFQAGIDELNTHHLVTKEAQRLILDAVINAPKPQ